MTLRNHHALFTLRTLMLVALGSALAAVIATVGVLYAVGQLAPVAATRQAMVHTMGANVMPFDLGQTTHIFQMTDTGGVQQVIANDPGNASQVALIQQHLQHEALQFQAGNFADPSALHGAAMPGLAALQAGAGKLTISYAPLPDGGQITFTASDVKLMTAIHQWFGAQLSDHGRDAETR